MCSPWLTTSGARSTGAVVSRPRHGANAHTTGSATRTNCPATAMSGEVALFDQGAEMLLRGVATRAEGPGGDAAPALCVSRCLSAQYGQ